MWRTVVREFHWEPRVLGSLYFDEIDHKGLIFWYNDVVKVHEEMKKNREDK
jgi:hypothetical protein